MLRSSWTYVGRNYYYQMQGGQVKEQVDDTDAASKRITALDRRRYAITELPGLG
jgi:hypothetical protein